MNPLSAALLGQQLAETLRQQYGGCTAAALAQALGIPIRRASWQVADGRIVYFAECTRVPLQITLNEATLKRYGKDETAHAQLTEVVIAHELFHLLAAAQVLKQASPAFVESAAHAFAQAWTGLPFHPTQFEEMLRKEFQPV